MGSEHRSARSRSVKKECGFSQQDCSSCGGRASPSSKTGIATGDVRWRQIFFGLRCSAGALRRDMVAEIQIQITFSFLEHRASPCDVVRDGGELGFKTGKGFGVDAERRGGRGD
jgi:hypothetical protein